MFLLFVREEEAALSLSVISLWDFHTGRTALFSTLLTTLFATHLATRIPWSEQRERANKRERHMKEGVGDIAGPVVGANLPTLHARRARISRQSFASWRSAPACVLPSCVCKCERGHDAAGHRHLSVLGAMVNAWLCVAGKVFPQTYRSKFPISP